MACRGCWECLLKLLNFLMCLSGLAIVGFGIYLFVEYEKSSSASLTRIMPASSDTIEVGRPMLTSLSLSSSFLDVLQNAWFIIVFIGVGVILFVISCFGCVGGAMRNRCCLTCYAVLVLLLILVELACAAFIFFDKNWQEVIPTDKTGDFDMVYEFLEENWDIIRWVALGIVILEVVLFVLALIVRATNRPTEYDSDDEYIGGPRQQIRQPLINRPPVPPSGVPVAGTLDNRPSRNDAWSTRMREKYGLDTSEFTYNPSASNRYQQAVEQPVEQSRRCTIM
ncbi:hypothetical protein NMG60_11030155 [Bertholletia excelsa]